jgi:hypothetical protein
MVGLLPNSALNVCVHGTLCNIGRLLFYHFDTNSPVSSFTNQTCDTYISFQIKINSTLVYKFIEESPIYGQGLI